MMIFGTSIADICAVLALVIGIFSIVVGFVAACEGEFKLLLFGIILVFSAAMYDLFKISP